MLVVDAQVHIWSGGRPPAAAASGGGHRPIESFSADELLREMDAAGVSAGLIHPPTSWDPNSNALAEAAAQAHPDRLAVMGHFDLTQPRREITLASWKRRPGQLGLRFTFNQPHTRPWLTDGTADWLWAAAEQARVPIAMIGAANLPLLDQVATRHPGLKLIVDHFGIRRSPDGDGFDYVDELVALARHPNVALKATGAPAYSREGYPFRDIHPVMQRLYEAFGPQRYFWGTDITRMPCSYAECVSMFTEELSWLTGDDLELVMGRALCEWLGWDLPSKP
jgi:predicted TIM-barrel fold metal-dependent hydrolase